MLAGPPFLRLGHYRKEYFGFGATAFSLFWEARTIGNTSYIFSGDLNGDSGTGNDLIYIPRNISEMNFPDIHRRGARSRRRSRRRRGKPTSSRTIT